MIVDDCRIVRMLFALPTPHIAIRISVLIVKSHRPCQTAYIETKLPWLNTSRPLMPLMLPLASQEHEEAHLLLALLGELLISNLIHQPLNLLDILHLNLCNPTLTLRTLINRTRFFLKYSICLCDCS
jgi:hypothetical protein